MPQKNNQYLSEIDILKCIAIFFVINYHCMYFEYAQRSTLLYTIRYFIYTLFSTCVPLFFFINGYLLLNKPFDIKKHLIRCLRILIITSIWAALGLILFKITGHISLTSHEILHKIFTPDKSPVAYTWYMGTLFCIYIFFPLIKAAYDTNYKAFIIFVLTIAVMTFGFTFINQTGGIFLSLKHGRPQDFYISFMGMYNPFKETYAYTMVYFCAGGTFCKYKEKILSVPSIKRNLISVTVLFTCWTLLFLSGIIFSHAEDSFWDSVWFGYDTIYTFVNVCMLYILSLNFKSVNKIIKTIAGNTLGIYLIHPILIQLLEPYTTDTIFMYSWVFNIVYTIAIFLISLLITLVLRKLPVINSIVKL